jgi:gamma-glutamyltranspeptidase
MSEFGPGTPSTLSVEPGITSNIVDGLRARGHQVEVLEQSQPGWGPASLIEIDADARRAAADPRVETTEALVF